MCAFCAMMAGGTHWTEAGTDAGRAGEAESGRTALVAHLPQVWAAAEEIAGRPLDPLDPALLDALRHTATAQRDRHRRPRPD